MRKVQDGSINENFGSVIKYLREKKGLSLLELNEITGISQSYISRIENGSRLAPTIPIIIALANALETDLSELLQLAGVEKQEVTGKFIGELILSNEFVINDCSASNEQKELLVKIVDIVLYSNWELKQYDCIAELLKTIHHFRLTLA